ncbi:MAG: nucleoside triphosphate pyrophosphohydrolase family protein [Saprospiraceae bacterium]|nr:nucleoside triphosphate pyrophosphohydrolase family protein [Saprospiraceae bacterium]
MNNHIFPEPGALTSVAKFHDTFNLPVLPLPLIPAEDRCRLRIALLQEELDELKEALANKDIVEAADALADLQYVLSGAVLELGLGSIFKELFDEVQRSNMSKTCKTLDEATATQNFYLEHKQIESHIVQRDGEFLVYRTEDGKVLKSVNYSPADLRQFVKSEISPENL